MGGNAKIEFIARITDEDGHIIERTVSATHGFAFSADFDMSSKTGFLSDFGILEEAILEARNRAGQEITADFLELASKKRKSRQEINNSRVEDWAHSFTYWWDLRQRTQAQGAHSYRGIYGCCCTYLCES